MDKIHDIIIIGAGVVGCALARALSRYKLDVLVLEKEDDVAGSTSKANSGVIHAGYHKKPGSLKATLNVAGHSYFQRLSDELDFPVKFIGKLVVAKKENEIEDLRKLMDRGFKNGVKGLELIDGKQIKHFEPNVNGFAAMHSPVSGITSPYLMCIALAENAHLNGVDFVFDTEVTGISKEKEIFVVQVSNGSIYRSRWLINSAGLNSARVSQMICENDHRMYPCRGEYYITDKVDTLIKRLIYPTPSKDGVTLGIHITPTLDGNILIGPSAEYIERLDDTASTREVMDKLKRESSQFLPPIKEAKFIRNYAGIRAKLFHPSSGVKDADFVIEEDESIKRMINLIGIESPGLTAAPAIAEKVVGIIGEKEALVDDEKFNPERKAPVVFEHLSDDEKARLIEQDPDYGEIVCRCETITKKEVLAALNNPLGVRTLDGVKKRCRAGMGRCQGGFCTPRIVEIMTDEYGISPEEIYKNNESSNMFFGKVKDDREEG
ncbi:NAD(P)/FAD-dependent oxidoreductase [bacterium]|nr:NAD(P)/FAD-dependent oxidoreductase [bacterium]